ncbi:MAG: radical SAM protein [Alphaproteobacteria bacterium]|nr:radical SAM protein [Alphaproteobacteria bacterium]MBV8336618.1 radical SAM protein [Alphaproteobacteria bacterium]
MVLVLRGRMGPLKTLAMNARKFEDPLLTANGERRAHVSLKALETLWFNTGTLCNLTCQHCYIESSPKNDRLVYLTAAEVARYLDEVQSGGWATSLIGFTGGEPFMNPELPAMLGDALSRSFAALVLTNAMKPMAKCKAALLRLKERYGERLTIRVSIDHYAPSVHELERGKRSWSPTMNGLVWLARNGFSIHVASRRLSGEPEDVIRSGFARLFAALDVPIDADDPVALTIFPEMDLTVDVPEITEACWGILGRSPESVMCATSRMVVKRKGAAVPAVLACTLLPYDPRFELGSTLAEASGAVSLNHPHCAKFCVLGGGACSRAQNC